jgi:hypothetical protein
MGMGSLGMGIGIGIGTGRDTNKLTYRTKHGRGYESVRGRVSQLEQGHQGDSRGVLGMAGMTGITIDLSCIPKCETRGAEGLSRKTQGSRTEQVLP